MPPALPHEDDSSSDDESAPAPKKLPDPTPTVQRSASVNTLVADALAAVQRLKDAQAAHSKHVVAVSELVDGAELVDADRSDPGGVEVAVWQFRAAFGRSDRRDGSAPLRPGGNGSLGGGAGFAGGTSVGPSSNPSPRSISRLRSMFLIRWSSYSDRGCD